jgi:hypothetical protein
MPSTSKKQHNFMAAVAHSSDFAKKAGVPQSVGKDFTKADKGLKFRKGGTSNSAVAGINKQQTHHGKMQLPNVSLNKYMGKKEGGMATESKKEMREEMKSDTAQDKKIVKKAVGMHDKQQHGGKATNLSSLKAGGRIPSKGDHPIQKQAKRGAEMVKMARGGGIEVRGKTKGTMVKMKGC